MRPEHIVKHVTKDGDNVYVTCGNGHSFNLANVMNKYPGNRAKDYLVVLCPECEQRMWVYRNRIWDNMVYLTD